MEVEIRYPKLETSDASANAFIVDLVLLGIERKASAMLFIKYRVYAFHLRGSGWKT
jgi:hypothetical protein